MNIGSSSPRPPAPTPVEEETITQNESDVINNNDGSSSALTIQT